MSDNPIVAQHHVIDIETLDTIPSAVVLSIGVQTIVARANGDLGYGETFLRHLSVAEQIISGRTTSEETVNWWRKQEAADAFRSTGLITTYQALRQLRLYLDAASGIPQFVWGNGAGFDLPILESLGRDFDVPDVLPPFYTHRCCRTLFAQLEKGQRIQPDQPHYALADATAEADTLIKYFPEFLHGKK